MDESMSDKLANRFMKRYWYAWLLVMISLHYFVAVPVAHAALVCVLRGRDAYSQGIRVISDPPNSRFSDGDPISNGMMIKTTLGAFFLFWMIPSLLLCIALNYFERHNPKATRWVR